MANQNGLTNLLTKLIQIPSWVDYSQTPIKQNENKLVDFLVDWLKQNTNVDIEKQSLPGGRFNVICKKGQPHLLFLAHTDTVAPSVNADQLRGAIRDGKIYGRGATDMKSGLAALLWAIKNNPQADNYWASFYADEEYFFLGMKGFAQKHSLIRPKYIISADGSDLAIGHGCRGLIELRLRLKGITGHAAKGNGLNAIEGVFLIYEDVRKYLAKFSHPIMGKCSSNLAWILAGAEKENSYAGKFLTAVGQAGNVIPNIAEFIIDIRPSDPKISANSVIKRMKSCAAKHKYGFEVVSITHDLGAWYTDKELIEPFKKLAQKSTGKQPIIKDPKSGGYLDLQMIWSTTEHPISVMFGGGDGSTAHRSDEYISIDSLNKTGRFFDLVLKDLH